MLHRLPNEILLKILEKTKSKTVKECRLLNSQFDNLIQQFQLHLLKIDFLTIDTDSDGDYALSLTFGEPKDPQLINLKFNSYEEMFSELTNQIRKVQSVKELDFSRISINEDLLRVFTNQRWIRKLDVLWMIECIFVRNGETYWFSFLSKLRLNVLILQNFHPDAFQKTILNNVRSKFVYRADSTGDVIAIPWMDDSLLENYIDSGKTIWVDYAFTSYTLGGVKEFLKELSKSGRTISWESGIMKNVTAEEMENLLKELKAEYDKYDERKDKYIRFYVEKLGAKQGIHMLAVRNLTLN